MKILITGGCGYLGKTICNAFIDAGHECVIIDTAADKETPSERVSLYCADISDSTALKNIVAEHPDIYAAIHCAELSTVSLSVSNPYEYYSLNVVKTMEFFKNLHDLGINRIIFSSSAAVYDNVPGYMVTERSPIKPRSPFGRTKYITEMMLKDFCSAYNMQCIALRYFNPIGADPRSRSGLVKGSANIISRLIRILNCEENTFVVSGDDWDTRDGTCVRDYIHVWDVAQANVKAIENFEKAFENAGSEYNDNFLSLNIGSGVDVTVKEFIMAFENVTGEKINTRIGPRRQGDISGSYANIRLAQKAIGWKPTYSLEDAIFDALRWDEENGDR